MSGNDTYVIQWKYDGTYLEAWQGDTTWWVTDRARAHQFATRGQAESFACRLYGSDYDTVINILEFKPTTVAPEHQALSAGALKPQ